VELRDELKEIDFGRCAGVTQAEAYREFPALESARRRDKWGHPWPGGESYAQATLRVAALLTELQEVADCERPTLIVAHQSINRVLIHSLTGVDPACVLESDQPSPCVIRVESGGLTSHAILPDISWRDGLPRSSRPRPPAFATGPEWGRSVAR
jgi:probable phosphoglycerate mutase